MTLSGLDPSSRYRPLTEHNIERSPFWSRLDGAQQEALRVVSKVLPFRTNEYVAEQLIDWSRLPDDPMFQLTFGQRGMLDPADYGHIRDLLADDAPRQAVRAAADAIRRRLNPQPGGQIDANVPRLEGQPVPGIQHKYRETVLFFPASGQTCHAYCTYCFRWAQFVDLPEMRFAAKHSDGLVSYLKAHPEVTDVLFTGGDPLIMGSSALRRYIEPLLVPELSHVKTVRIGTKALAYWPQRVVSDEDADDLLRLFDDVVASGRHLALMAHASHPVELSTDVARTAVRRVRATGAEIRLQAPMVRHVNDDADVWADLWSTAVHLGMTPYYLFVERDTGPRRYFELPLVEAYTIYRQACQQVSGLARTARGPCMSCYPGKVRVLGVSRVAGEEVFVLDLLQGRDPSWVRRPFFARFDPQATWFDDLQPAFGDSDFFFQRAAFEPSMTAAPEPRLAVDGT